MNNKKRKNIIRNLLLCLSIAAVLITGAWYTQTNIKLSELQAQSDSLKAEIKSIERQKKKGNSGITNDDVLKVYKGNDIVQLEKQVKKLELRYKTKSTKLSVIDDIIYGYIKGRYNFNGSPKSNIDKVISKVTPYINDDMRKSLETELSKSSTGNMGTSDNFQHTAKVTDVYYTDIEILELNGNDSKMDYDNLPYYITAIAKVKMNNSYTAYIRYDLSHIENEWLIISENILTDDIQISND